MYLFIIDSNLLWPQQVTKDLSVMNTMKLQDIYGFYELTKSTMSGGLWDDYKVIKFGKWLVLQDFCQTLYCKKNNLHIFIPIIYIYNLRQLSKKFSHKHTKSRYNLT